MAERSIASSRRGAEVASQKFVCHIVGENTTEYAQGIVSCDFKDRENARRAKECFTDGYGIAIRTPAVKTRTKAQWLGSAKKNGIILERPT